MKKRIIAVALVIVTFFTSTFSLSGCNKSEETALQMGQWLMLVADSFGMVTYVEETPYFPEVREDDPSFAAFQMAAEWEILEPSEEITATTPITWNDVLITLVNAGEFVEAGATDEEKVEYAINNFDSNIDKSWGKDYIELEEALPLLEIAQKMWASKEYTEKIETIAFAEDVKNYLDDINVDYAVEENVVSASAEQFSDLKVGDVYILPANEMNPASINKVKDIQIVDGQVLIQNDENFTEEEAGNYIGEVLIQETAALDFGNVVGIYDENGNPITYEVDNSFISTEMNKNENALAVTTLAYSDKDNANNIQTGLFDNVKVPIKFKVKDFDVSITMSSNDISVEVSKELSKTSNRYREQKTKEYIKASFKDVKLTKDIDYSWGVLHSATVKLDYKTAIEGGVKTTRQTEIGKPEKDDKNIKQGLQTTINQYKKALEEFNKDMRNSKCNEEIYICKLKIVDGGFASVNFIIKGKVSAEGNLKIVVELEGAQGIQYKKGNLRYINEKDIDVDFAADAKLEVTIGPGLGVSILEKIVVAEVTIDAGVGALVAMVAHLFDAEGHELYSADVTISGEDADSLADEELYTTAEDIKAFAEEMGGTWDAKDKDGSVRLMKGICLKWSLYPVLKINLSAESLIAKVVKITPSKEILGKDNTIFKGHIDFPNNITSMIESDSFSGGLTAFLGIGAECTYDYTPWDSLLEEETETSSEFETENEEIPVSDVIEISEISMVLDVEESKVLRIIGIPDGYELKDIVAEIEDESIATFDLKTGTVTGVSAGVTQLVIKTKDEKHKVFCAITVNENNEIEFEELDDVKIV